MKPKLKTVTLVITLPIADGQTPGSMARTIGPAMVEYATAQINHANLSFHSRQSWISFREAIGKDGKRIKSRTLAVHNRWADEGVRVRCTYSDLTGTLNTAKSAIEAAITAMSQIELKGEDQ